MASGSTPSPFPVHRTCRPVGRGLRPGGNVGMLRSKLRSQKVSYLFHADGVMEIPGQCKKNLLLLFLLILVGSFNVAFEAGRR